MAHSSRRAARLAMTPLTVFRTLRISLVPAVVVALAVVTGACTSKDDQKPTDQSASPGSSVITSAAAASERPERAAEPGSNALGSERPLPGGVLASRRA